MPNLPETAIHLNEQTLEMVVGTPEVPAQSDANAQAANVATAPAVVIETPAAPAEEPMLYCPVCDLKLNQRKCKLFCERCGYFMSCADYY
jgi:hypothetical protein